MKYDLLFKMLETPSVSGLELEFQKMLIEELKDIDDVCYKHQSCNVVHGINPNSDVKIMLLAHIDEIGLMIENVLDNGICKLTNVGSIKPYMYLGQHVKVIHNCLKEKKVFDGVIGYNPEMNSGKMSVEHLNLDLGFTSKQEALENISIGDVVVHSLSYTMLKNNLLSGRALDNKLGAYICSQVLKKVKESKKDVGVYFAATVGEETTCRGAKFSANDLDLTCAIAIDVGSATDVKYRDSFTKDVRLGNGPIFTIASHANIVLSNMIKDSAKRLNIPLQEVVEISKTYTDMDEIYHKNGGIPSQLISIPLRYMHSSVEVCSLDDVDSIIDLLVEVIMNIKTEDSFNPFDVL